jgi:threonylcarbamoyladenosine tRNA methylthiotransferase MtaB
VYVHTHGCRLNAAESRTFIETLEAAGYEVAQVMDRSIDVAIVNSCAVTQEAESKCKQTIRQIVRTQPHVALVITGCLAEKNPSELLGLHDRILILGNSEKHRIFEHIDRLDLRKKFTEISRYPIVKSDFEFPCLLHRPYRQRYNLKIQEGCNFFCSYCIIPTLRGRARSRDFKNLIEDAEIHVRQGVREIVLTGTNIGVYRNSGKKLSDVIATLNEIPELQRIRLSSIEFKTIDDAILTQMADPKHKLVKYLHLPIQSGSDRILRAMRRHYTLAEAEDYVESVAKAIPNIGLGTDLIVGFPGESDEDFECSIHLIQETAFQYVHVFSYARREGTAANLLEGQFVTRNEIDRRSKVLRDLSWKKRCQFFEQQIGKTELVLFEDRKKSAFPGFTENYIKVLVLNAPRDLSNQIGKVRLIQNCGTFIRGELIEESMKITP